MNDPGTQLKLILEELGITPSSECPCNEHVRLMDDWGVEGCKLHREEIIEWLRDEYECWGWRAILKHAAKGLFSGLAFKVSWPDPIPGLVDLAITRAR